MDFKLVDTVRLQKFKDKLLSIINTNVTTINNSISNEATARDAAISKAIATEVSNRNSALAKKSDTGHTHSDATTSASGFMSATDKTKLDGIATGAGVQVNSDWNATTGVSAILNKPTKVSAFTNDSGYLTSHQSLANYALKTDIPTVTTYTAGQGIKIENGVISVIPTKIGNPTCPDYTLYGDYFLSDIMTPSINWNDACKMKESVIVTQKYNYGANQTKVVYAKLLSKKDLETLTNNQRKINISGLAYDYYWTNTNYGASTNSAWTVYNRNGDILEKSTNSNSTCCARLGFKNPFI